MNSQYILGLSLACIVCTRLALWYLWYFIHVCTDVQTCVLSSCLHSIDWPLSLFTCRSTEAGHLLQPWTTDCTWWVLLLATNTCVIIPVSMAMLILCLYQNKHSYMYMLSLCFYIVSLGLYIFWHCFSI